MSATATTSSFADRIVGAATFNDRVYEEVEADRSATMQAVLVVVLGAIAAGIGATVRAGFIGLIVVVLVALASWTFYAWLTYWLGTGILKGEHTQADWGQVARTLGFANAPRLVLVLDVLGLGFLLNGIVQLWILVTTVVALRAALDVTTGRAIAIAAAGWIVQVLVTGLLIALQSG